MYFKVHLCALVASAGNATVSFEDMLIHLWQWLQPSSLLEYYYYYIMPQAWHTYLWTVPLIPLFFSSYQVWWEASLHSHFQIFQEILSQIQVWAVAGPLKDTQRSLLWKPGCLLRVIVLLKVEPWPQSVVKRALEQVFIQDVSFHCCCSTFW